MYVMSDIEWDNLFGITSTLIFNNQYSQISLTSNKNNLLKFDSNDYCFLLSPSSFLRKHKKSLSSDSISQQTVSSENLTVSLDFHLPSDEQNMVLTTNNTQQYNEISR